MIEEGVKTEEYREIKPYWINRLTADPYMITSFMDTCINCAHAIVINMDEDGGELVCGLQRPKDIFHDGIDSSCNIGKYTPDYVEFLPFTHICFSNGYAKNRPQFTVELKGISIGTGKPEWGAIEGKQYFVLELGEITDRKNIWKPTHTDEQVLNEIDRWNGNHRGLIKLQEHLGWTFEEYSIWVDNNKIPLREVK
jgi:hypothetical protein